jgi:ABC-2 type transport system ATP-binding protein
VWDIVRVLVGEGATVLLTTQYLDEADQLAGRLAIIDHGRVIAEGTCGELKASVGAGSLHVRVRETAQREDARRVLAGSLGTEVTVDGDPASLSVADVDADRAAAALAALTSAGVPIAEFALGQPSLDEVFLALTGHAADDTTTEEHAA